MATVETVGEFLEYIQANHASADDFWYRGHASVGWGLSPSVFRTPGRQENERLLLKRFMQEARRHSSDVPSEEWDWTFLAQHHFVPTRLLDWSESPLVGLYFAALDTFDIADDPKTARDGRIWILQPNKLNSQVGHPFVGRDLPMFGVDGMLDSYRPFCSPNRQTSTCRCPSGQIVSKDRRTMGNFHGIYGRHIHRGPGRIYNFSHFADSPYDSEIWNSNSACRHRSGRKNPVYGPVSPGIARDKGLRMKYPITFSRQMISLEALSNLRKSVVLDPHYQRQGDVWRSEKLRDRSSRRRLCRSR